MKRILLILLCAVMLLSVPGCKEKPSEKELTLMVYMIGSDLEAKSGAGTNDMQEMTDSGVNLSKTNVLVYAGGSPKWHNDNATPEEHTLMRLTGDGFQNEATFPAASMGEPDSLSAFLNHCHQNFPAKDYALILWDHGDGPVIGYGKDMLNGNDSLTLKEMQTALAASPFGKDHKLAWVGFDACLMASAELACVWADYADYLIASQDIEPSFGWNYSFLSKVNGTDREALFKNMTADYLTACQEYYARKGYDARDTTLSAMNLSYAGELSAAINTLFAKATPNVTGSYNQLTARRVQTRAIGRATTGSEYDLIDLNDFAAQLSDLYPTETAALQEVIAKMVLSNSTNAEKCCGLSLYYPFYNKTYFEKDWNVKYKDLGIFPDYLSYLESYAAKWLGNDLLTSVAASTMPSAISKDTFALDLTDSQAAAYANARYYILQREGHGIYTRVFSSQNVTRNGNRLVANFDGQILYAKNDFNEYFIPVTVEHDTVGNNTRYSAYVTLNNDNAESLVASQSAGYRFHLSANNTTKDIAVSALVPYDAEVDTGTLAGGKQEDADLSGWTTYWFPQERHRYLSRYENGTVMPLSQWPASSYFSANVSSIGDGLEFLFSPLVAGEYYLLFEIEDTQGSHYCSEPLAIQTTGSLEAPKIPDPLTVNWTSGERILLTEQNGIVIYLTTVDSYNGKRYTFQVENKTQDSITVSIDNVFINDSTYCHDAYAFPFSISPGLTKLSEDGLSLETINDLGLAENLKSLHFTLKVVNTKDNKTLIKNQAVSVTLSAETALPPLEDIFADVSDFDVATRGILATEQELGKLGDVRITLLGLGGSGVGTSLNGAVRIENPTDAPVTLGLTGVVFDGITVPITTGMLTIPAESVTYDDFLITEENLDLRMIQSAQKVTLQFKAMNFYTLSGGGGFSRLCAFPVQLAQSGKPAAFTEGSKLLYNEGGVRIALLKEERSDFSHDWYLTVVNSSDRGISLSMTDLIVNGEAMDPNYYYDLAISEGQIGAGEKAVCELTSYSPDTLKEFSFRFQLYDYFEETLLSTGKDAVTLVPVA